jgi:hypothetical protein
MTFAVSTTIAEKDKTLQTRKVFLISPAVLLAAFL